MFKQVPYGVKVRIKGSEATGFKTQLCINYARFLPSFMNIWTDISRFKGGKRYVTYETIEEAKEVALKEYDEWIDYYKRREEETRLAGKVYNKTVWEHP